MADTKLPTRGTDLSATTNTSVPTSMTDDEAVPDQDPTNTTGLLSERLRAYKHMCGFLEEYIKAVSHEQKSNGKDQEKVLKSISKPLREGHHFDQALGGVAGLFENIRSNTSAISNMHFETSKNLDGTVLPMLERLHKEIKNKDKELAGGAGKAAKAVERARNESQKYIEMLGTHSANFDSSGGRVTSHNDPYVLQRGIFHRLNKQLIEENNNRQDIIIVQDSFRQFEAHVLGQVQAALSSFQQFMASQSDRQKAIYGDIVAVASHIPPDFEWNGFVKRNQNLLIDPQAPPKKMSTVTFPNQGHRSTKPLIEGSLERKSRMGALKGYSAGYFAVTPAGFLHEFKDNDDFRHEPSPEISLYLPDCVVGAVVDTKFTVKGKDASGGKMGSKFATSSEYTFKAHTPQDAAEWHRIIGSKATTSSSTPTSTTTSAVTSPVESRNVSGAATLPPTAAEQEKEKEASQEKAAAQPGTIDTAGIAEPTSGPTSAASPTNAGTGTEPGTGAAGAGAGTGAGVIGSQEAGIVRNPSTAVHSNAGARGASATSPTSPTQGNSLNMSPSVTSSSGQGSHFHGQPAATGLEDRKYVQK